MFAKLALIYSDVLIHSLTGLGQLGLSLPRIISEDIVAMESIIYSVFLNDSWID
jgi:hypothetical protein